MGQTRQIEQLEHMEQIEPKGQTRQIEQAEHIELMGQARRI